MHKEQLIDVRSKQKMNILYTDLKNIDIYRYVYIYINIKDIGIDLQIYKDIYIYMIDISTDTLDINIHRIPK